MVTLLASLVALTLLAPAQPAAKPNFSGEWKMNVEKSNFGPLPPPTSITRSIAHAEPALTIEEHQLSAMGEQKQTRKYVTDGTAMTFESQGATVNSSASWSDNALVVISKVDVVGLTFNDTMTLSADGKTMTSAVKIASPQGEVDVTVVFDKQ
jgi:hypothetical protein